jgi:membrane protease YdiL (CAAX protease family)
MNNSTSPQSNDQYSLAKILGIWALAAVPMAVLGWVVYPVLAPDLETNPLGAGVTRMNLITVGLIWQFVLSMIIVRREEGDLRWATIKRRLRLNTTRDPKTGQTRGRLWLWFVPLIIGVLLKDMIFSSKLIDFWVSIFPFFAAPPGFDAGTILGLAEVQAQLAGAWWFLGLFVVMMVFNSILGEEFLFRGVLLPKMEGVFGKWDWVANGVLFGFYHLHQPWHMLRTIIFGSFLWSLPAKRFRSTWISIAVHSVASLYLIFLVLGIVLGMA